MSEEEDLSRYCEESGNRSGGGTNFKCTYPVHGKPCGIVVRGPKRSDINTHIRGQHLGTLAIVYCDYCDYCHKGVTAVHKHEKDLHEDVVPESPGYCSKCTLVSFKTRQALNQWHINAKVCPAREDRRSGLAGRDWIPSTKRFKYRGSESNDEDGNVSMSEAENEHQHSPSVDSPSPAPVRPSLNQHKPRRRPIVMSSDSEPDENGRASPSAEHRARIKKEKDEKDRVQKEIANLVSKDWLDYCSEMSKTKTGHHNYDSEAFKRAKGILRRIMKEVNDKFANVLRYLESLEKNGKTYLEYVPGTGLYLRIETLVSGMHSGTEILQETSPYDLDEFDLPIRHPFTHRYIAHRIARIHGFEKTVWERAMNSRNLRF